MASGKWSNLPSDILSIIAKILNTDVDILRLRSVCSTWRSSVPPRLRPSSFPLKLPPFRSAVLYSKGKHFLKYTTVYRLSPPESGPYAGDCSDGWLIRVSEVNPNRFTFLAPLSEKPYQFIRLPPSTITKHLNLLHYRISEICKCYWIYTVDEEGFPTDTMHYSIRKVVVISNYAVDCDFVVLALSWGETGIHYWKFGDNNWTLIDNKGYSLTDMIVYNGKCFVIDTKGVLLSLDSKFNLNVVPSLPRLPVGSGSLPGGENFLVEYKSDLYAMVKMDQRIWNDKDEGCDEKTRLEIPLGLKIFKKCDNDWNHVTCLGNEVLISCADVSVGLSTEDFRGRKGNCVYFGHSLIGHPLNTGFNMRCCVYDLDKRRSFFLKMGRDCTMMMYWPPPSWLMSD